LIGYLAGTTALGAWLAGRQATIRDFFLGGRRLPWLAVAGSIIATEISAVTFIAVPGLAFRADGDLTYFQLALGAVLARVIVAVWFVPAFYEREIYSPYDYMGNRLGAPVRTVTSALFALGAVLGQSVRVLTTAIVLELMTGLPLSASIWIIGGVAVLWTLLGGITTVIWTDVVQFIIFAAGLAIALLWVVGSLPGGWGEYWGAGQAAGKFRLWSLSLDPAAKYTLWTALIANTILCLNAYGTDQMMTQRMFCCRGPREARRAIVASSVGVLLALLALFVGVGLFIYYRRFPLSGDAADLIAADPDRVLPLFILHELPVGLTGLLIAAIFAAAISSLDSVLAALSQTVVAVVYQPWRERRRAAPTPAPGPQDHHYVRASRLFVIGWGVVLCGVAQVAQQALAHYRTLLDLALAMATYTGGTLLAGFFLAFLRLNVNYRGLVWAAPLSIITVFALNWHQPRAQTITIVAAVGVLVAFLIVEWRRAGSSASPRGRSRTRFLLRSSLVAAAAALAIFIACFRWSAGGSAHYLAAAWPWNVPVGFAVAFGLGYLLAEARDNVLEQEPRLSRD